MASLAALWQPDSPCADVTCRYCGGATVKPEFPLDSCIHWCEACQRPTRHRGGYA